VKHEFDFCRVFNLDVKTGVLYWRAPPKNHAEKLGCIAGYICKGKGANKDYWQIRAFSHTFKRSRVVFYMTHGYWPMPMADHINGNSLDDRPDNLRQCSPSMNTVNSKAKKRKYDLPRGVCETKQGRFMARICVNGKPKSLGTFDSVCQAKRVYEKKRKEIFGEFA